MIVVAALDHASSRESLFIESPLILFLPYDIMLALKMTYSPAITTLKMPQALKAGIRELALRDKDRARILEGLDGGFNII
jgi:hypothetical protein